MFGVLNAPHLLSLGSHLLLDMNLGEAFRGVWEVYGKTTTKVVCDPHERLESKNKRSQ